MSVSGQSFSMRSLAAGLLAAALVAPATLAQEGERQSIRIGYAVPLTGPNATGAGITTIPNYKLWVHDVNADGGITLGDGRTLPVEVIEYDDRSSTEEAVRAIERLATQDEVDFILPTWGTGPNLAIGPTFDRFGYPQLAATSVTDRAPDLVARWPMSFWFLGGGHDYATALVELLTAERDKGTINNKVAVVSVADGFGIDLARAAMPAFEDAGFEVVYERSYPLGTSDFTPIINEVSGLEADTFVAFSYPPGTLSLTQTAIVSGYNPAIFYTGVGTAFPLFQQRFGANAEGVMGIGGIDPDSEEIAAYFERHEEVTGQKPDSWASAVTYASLQMLEQAIERVGEIDREAVAAELSSGSFDTILGEMKLENNQLRALWTVGQWQDGRFVGISHTRREAAREPVVPKPAWQPAN